MLKKVGLIRSKDVDKLIEDALWKLDHATGRISKYLRLLKQKRKEKKFADVADMASIIRYYCRDVEAMVEVIFALQALKHGGDKKG